MKKIWMLILPLSLIYFTGACKKKKDDCQPESYLSNFQNNAKVDTTSLGGLTSINAYSTVGNKSVFVYTHAHSPCSNIADGFVTYHLIFEVDPTVNSFRYSDIDLGNANCYFTYYTDGRSLLGSYKPASGTISGTKINQRTWNVQFDLSIRNNQAFKGSAIFSLQ